MCLGVSQPTSRTGNKCVQSIMWNLRERTNQPVIYKTTIQTISTCLNSRAVCVTDDEVLECVKAKEKAEAEEKKIEKRIEREKKAEKAEADEKKIIERKKDESSREKRNIKRVTVVQKVS